MNTSPRSEKTDGPWESESLAAREEPQPRRFADFSLSFVTLALVAFSLTALALTLTLGAVEQRDFLVRNVLGDGPRKPLLLTLLGAALVVPTTVSLAMFARHRERAVAELSTLATVLAPLITVWVLPLLFSWQFAQDKPLYFLCLLSSFVLALRKLLTHAFERAFAVAECGTHDPHAKPSWLARLRALRVSPAAALAVVVLAAGGYAAFFGYYSVHRHHLIQTTAFDLGIYDNLLYNALIGRPFASPVLFGPGNHNYIAGHAEYAMLLFLPLYALWPGPETLLWLQAVMFGGAAIPLFFFARQLLAPLPAMLISLAYLLFAPLHGPNFYDFHWLPLAMFFHFTLYYALATRKNWLAIPVVLVLFAIREDVAVGLAVLGVFLVLTGTRVRFGVVLSAVSAAWFALNKFVIMPWAGTWWFENMYKELFADGHKSYGSVIVTLLSNPSYALTTFLRENKLTYALHMLAPLVFLPLRKPALALLLLPGCVFTLMTTGYSPAVSIAFQYTTHSIPYLFLALVLSLWLYREEPSGKAKLYAALVALCIGVLAHSHGFGAVLQQQSVTGGFGKIYFAPLTKPQAARYAALQEILKRIPREASVAAGEYMNPHISARKTAYVFRYDVKKPDYVFFSKLELGGNLRKSINDLFAKHNYGLVASAHDEFYLWKRGHVSANTNAALRALKLNVRAPKPVRPRSAPPAAAATPGAAPAAQPTLVAPAKPPAAKP
jgi:uncharacterized membrane protein